VIAINKAVRREMLALSAIFIATSMLSIYFICGLLLGLIKEFLDNLDRELKATSRRTLMKKGVPAQTRLRVRC
jgi:hypothetical protein